MKILLVLHSVLPCKTYGGTQRVVWYLAKGLATLGHEVGLLAGKGTQCPFAKVHEINPELDLDRQIPEEYDVVHFNIPYEIDRPHLNTFHGDRNNTAPFPKNTVFISAYHAGQFDSDTYVYNGLDFEDYGPVSLNEKKNYFHFLGKAAWRKKNVKGAISLINSIPGARLKVLGGSRLNFKMGFRLTLSPKIHFHGMVGGEEKNQLLRYSKGLVFPVRWHEPFGLAITESLYFGAPVFGTPYGSLPELVKEEVGFLSANPIEVKAAIQNADAYNRQLCHEYAQDCFNHISMARGYLKLYEKVLAGENLHGHNPKRASILKEKFLPWE
ncbi:glycosyltransferase [Persicobacter diffluens]|uniref:Glycosyl transferase n=1 Tax=Persicobacter diffluens TaxID=981 RepID=A0AAN4W1X5_9BACT|nr:glycosyl transferase [Persicobacter diffluens]